MKFYSILVLGLSLLMTACGSESSSKEEAKFSCQLTFNTPTVEDGTYDYSYTGKNITDCAALWTGNKTINISYDVSKSYIWATLKSITFDGDSEQTIEINKSLNHTTIVEANKPVFTKTVTVSNVTNITMIVSYSKESVEQDSWYKEYGEIDPAQLLKNTFYMTLSE